jgi:hypothetical protein
MAWITATRPVGREDAVDGLALTRRFGDLPAWAERRIDAAVVTQLDTWLDGVLDATSLVGLIGPERGSV